MESEIKTFAQLGIQIAATRYVGDKIAVRDILDKQIIILAYKIEDSIKIKGDTCLHMQISLDGVKMVVFTSGKHLMKQLERTGEGDLPFSCKIIRENSQFLLT